MTTRRPAEPDGDRTALGATEQSSITGMRRSSSPQAAEFRELGPANGLGDIAAPCLSIPDVAFSQNPPAMMQCLALTCTIDIGFDILDPGATSCRALGEFKGAQSSRGLRRYRSSMRPRHMNMAFMCGLQI